MCLFVHTHIIFLLQNIHSLVVSTLWAMLMKDPRTPNTHNILLFFFLELFRFQNWSVISLYCFFEFQLFSSSNNDIIGIVFTKSSNERLLFLLNVFEIKQTAYYFNVHQYLLNTIFFLFLHFICSKTDNFHISWTYIDIYIRINI